MPGLVLRQGKGLGISLPRQKNSHGQFRAGNQISLNAHDPHHYYPVRALFRKHIVGQCFFNIFLRGGNIRRHQISDPPANQKKQNDDKKKPEFSHCSVNTPSRDVTLFLTFTASAGAASPPLLQAASCPGILTVQRVSVKLQENYVQNDKLSFQMEQHEYSDNKTICWWTIFMFET